MANRHSVLDLINAEIEKMTKKNFAEPDSRFWYPRVDKVGNGNAILRFLPAIDAPDSDGPEKLPFVRYWLHSFQGPTGLWIVNEMCPTTKEKACPICDLDRKLWNSGDESKIAQARRQKRKLKFVSNVYVVKDPNNPENEGQVRLFMYGVKIWDKIKEFMTPAFDGMPERDAFDLAGAPVAPKGEKAEDQDGGGANFILKIRRTKDGPNYDGSSFEALAPLSTDKAVIQAVKEKLIPLQPFVADALFNDYDTIKEKLDHVLGTEVRGGEVARSKFKNQEEEETEELQIPEEEEMDAEYFKRLANE